MFVHALVLVSTGIVSLDRKNQLFVSGTTAAVMQNSFNAESATTKNWRATTLQCIHFMYTILQNRPHLTAATMKTAPEWQLAWNDLASAICQPLPAITCDTLTKFRTIDGSCNNLRRPTLGQSFRPIARFLFPVYGDMISAPRTTGVNGAELPSARTISNILFQNQAESRFHKKHTMVLMSFGQILDHDIIFTPVVTAADGTFLACCPDTMPRQEECFPILIPPNDPFFTTTCMNFVRSSPVFNDPCKPGTREQMNELTSFIDGSSVYGSTTAQMNELRYFNFGHLRTRGNNLPPHELHNEECVITFPGENCMKAGDRRINEVPHLSINHIAFLREHNRIATRLAVLNKHWDDERLFQETRKIIGAIFQKIVYKDWLPIILHKGYIRKFCLQKSRSYRCRRQNYDPSINPTIRNAFVTAGLRIGHSLVPPVQGTTTKDFKFTQTQNTEETFFNPHNALTDVDGMARFVTKFAAMINDRFIVSALRDNLFTDGTTSFDLGALNIQRGRDHGLPPYTAYRRFCGLSTVTHFKRTRGGLIDHDPINAAKLEETYANVNDIDLFAGGLTECPLPGSILGPTFSCLFAKQFRALRYGDRFFYEHKGLSVSFSSAQIRAINQVTLSKIYCENHNIHAIQRNIFFLPKISHRVHCDSIKDLDLHPWIEH